MTELRFAAELYSGAALEAAARVYGEVARCEVTREGEHYRVALEAEADEATVADEFCNYALGVTIEARPAD